MTNKNLFERDFSKFRAFDNIPCRENEILYPVVMDRDMSEQLRMEGLDSRNVVRFAMPGSGRKVPVAFIRIREEAREVTAWYFNNSVHRYLNADTLFGDDLYSLDQILEELQEGEESRTDPTGTERETRELLSSLALDEVEEKLSRVDPLYSRIFSLLRLEFSKKEILERIGWTKGRSQGYALIDKVRRLARELYEG
ncbi:MAG: hypothetical protein IJV40_14085 [Oscillospiraceae bacterium]|nr:hypothetical protein [Oscillospiraceae bacterium]